MSNKSVTASWEKTKQELGNSRRAQLIKTFIGAGFRVKANGVRFQRRGDKVEAQ